MGYSKFKNIHNKVLLDRHQTTIPNNRRLSTDLMHGYLCPLKERPQASIQSIQTRIVELIDWGHSQAILNEKEKSFLVPSGTRTPIIYYLPKVHKNLVCTPGWPIVSSIDSITSRVDNYINTFLQPLVKDMPSYIRVTNAVINLLKDCPFQEG